MTRFCVAPYPNHSRTHYVTDECYAYQHLATECQAHSNGLDSC